MKYSFLLMISLSSFFCLAQKDTLKNTKEIDKVIIYTNAQIDSIQRMITSIYQNQKGKSVSNVLQYLSNYENIVDCKIYSLSNTTIGNIENSLYSYYDNWLKDIPWRYMRQIEIKDYENDIGYSKKTIGIIDNLEYNKNGLTIDNQIVRIEKRIHFKDVFLLEIIIYVKVPSIEKEIKP